MPKAIKKKVAKKSSANESDMKNIASKALDYSSELYARRKREMITAGSVAGLAALAIIIFMIYSSSVEQKARNLEADADNIYYSGRSSDIPGFSESDRLKKAKELYVSSVDVKATPSALYSLGNTYFNLGEYDNALREYRRFAEKFSHDEILPLVLQKMSSAYLKTGKKDEALKSLADLASINKGVFKDTALVLEARLYSAAGDNPSSIAKYEELVKEYPASVWAQEAVAKTAPKDKAEEGASASPQTENTAVK
ncbi:MAG: tetratricopeptide repeat protein [Nitrospirae bacterium]|nr:tetratricopeptide repeat protein [Nitrospirota bacterium]